MNDFIYYQIRYRKLLHRLFMRMYWTVDITIFHGTTRITMST